MSSNSLLFTKVDLFESLAFCFLKYFYIFIYYFIYLKKTNWYIVIIIIIVVVVVVVFGFFINIFQISPIVCFW